MNMEDKIIEGLKKSGYPLEIKTTLLLKSRGWNVLNQEGYLTGKVRTNPYSVILFDEIEKAHPEVLDILLQILDEGRLTDAYGRMVNFSETVIIMTSNIGASVANERKIGFGIKDEDHEQISGYEVAIKEAVAKTLRLELLNKIQKVIIFYPLSKERVI